jgi:hypothetical protein
MSGPQAVLVIDDEPERLRPLVAALTQTLGASVEVRDWQPSNDEDPLERFNSEVERGLGLVATDDDLTKSQLGLLGSAVTNWAQNRFIPVCNFSRKPQRRLPRERNFFELRLPHERDEAALAAHIARIYHGFHQVREHVDGAEPRRPIPQLLAQAMGIPQIEDDVAPFLASAASASSSLVQGVTRDDGGPDGIDRANFLTFILGHILFNAVLEFPGPILSRTTLTAYCAASPDMADALASLFADASYDGPFAAPGMYFQRRLVDRRIDELGADIDTADEPDEYNREAIERALGEVQPHDCIRCAGTRGGYWCPFTHRAVCNRVDCSVTSETWIPRGATLCRVERDYFEELAPLLGE